MEGERRGALGAPRMRPLSVGDGGKEEYDVSRKYPLPFALPGLEHSRLAAIVLLKELSLLSSFQGFFFLS